MIEPSLSHYVLDKLGTTGLERSKVLLSALLESLQDLELWEYDPDFTPESEPVNPDEFLALTLDEVQELLDGCIVGDVPEGSPEDDEEQEQPTQLVMLQDVPGTIDLDEDALEEGD